MTNACACGCGATGHILPPDVGYARDVRRELVEWHGGNIGAGRIAVEDLPADPTACPVCRCRACAYVVLPRTPRGPDTSGR